MVSVHSCTISLLVESHDSSHATCPNRTFDDSGLEIVRHSLSNDKWATLIRSYVAYNQATSLVKTRTERDFERDIIYVSKRVTTTAHSI